MKWIREEQGFDEIFEANGAPRPHYARRGRPRELAPGLCSLAQPATWIDVHSPRLGWLGFDTTHDREPNDRYVVVAYGRHHDDVAPNRGIYRGSASETLVAEVETCVSAPRDVAGLHEELACIQVPVFRELPVRLDADAELALESEEQPEQQ